MTNRPPTPRPRNSRSTSSAPRSGGAGRRRIPVWLMLALLPLAGACKATAVRPYITPFPDAPRDTLQADPADVIIELSGLVTAEGLQVGAVSAEEGYLETGWYDVESHSPTGSFGPDVDRYIRLRFFVDPVNPLLTLLVSEAVMRRTLDPSLSEREAETLVPPDHEGEQMLNRIRDALRNRHGGPSP